MSDEDDRTDLRSPLQRTVQRISEDLLGREVGDRVLTSVEYQQLCGVGSGTVQRAISTIEDTGALRLSRHGHRGTKIVELHHGPLWSLSGRGQVRIVVPIPGAINGFGLTKGLRAQFDRLYIPTDLDYMAGSRARASLVARSAADIAVMSNTAADALPTRQARATERVRLSFGTYYEPTSLVTLSRSDTTATSDRRNVRVACDPSSDDHRRLTEAEFPPNDPRHEYVECPYTSVPSLVLDGTVDLGVWHRTLLPAPLTRLGLIAEPLASPAVTELLTEMSPAVLLARKKDASLLRVLTKVDFTRVEKIQRDLVAKDPTSPATLEAMWSRHTH